VKKAKHVYVFYKRRKYFICCHFLAARITFFFFFWWQLKECHFHGFKGGKASQGAGGAPQRLGAQGGLQGDAFERAAPGEESPEP
jgi:hypothetical protein